MDVLEYITQLSNLLQTVQVTDTQNNCFSLQEGCRKAIDFFSDVKNQKKKVLLIGNGGSAAIVNHMQNDLCCSNGIRCIVFDEAPMLTALSNDHGYTQVFEKPVKLWADPGDLILAISSSGCSENILRAVEGAKIGGCRIITLSGFSDGNKLRKLGDLNFYVAAKSYGLVEMAHSTLTHFITDCLINA